MSTTETKVRSLHEIADEIKRDWRRPYFAAVPYINAMEELTSINDMLLFDSAKEIVQRFLVNASKWRGETAVRVKAELRHMVKGG